jgi:branched-chain amino acid aminotransferase
LDGISLRVVEELCGELGVPFAESPLTPEQCYTADEALVTSTAYGVAGVCEVNARLIPHPGPLLSRLRIAWSGRVGRDIWQ